VAVVPPVPVPVVPPVCEPPVPVPVVPPVPPVPPELLQPIEISPAETRPTNPTNALCLKSFIVMFSDIARWEVCAGTQRRALARYADRRT
jgi:hypothetical protein